jgi:hypothetical protein
MAKREEIIRGCRHFLTIYLNKMPPFLYIISVVMSLCSPTVRTQVPSQGSVIGVMTGLLAGVYHGLNPGRGSRFLSSPKRLYHITAHLASHAMSTVCSFLQRQSDLGVKLTIEIPVLLRLRMLLLFAFKMCTGTNSSLRKKFSKSISTSPSSMTIFLFESDQVIIVLTTVFGILKRKQTSMNTVHQQNDVM